MRSIARLWPLLFLACVERPLGDSATGDAGTDAPGSSTTATSPSTASDTTPGTTTPPTTGPSTSTSTTSTTSGPSSAVTTDVSTTSDPSDTTTGAVKLDLPRLTPVPPGLVGCTFDAPPGTALKGLTMQGQFESTRAWFGAQSVNGILREPNLAFLAPEADAVVELESKQGDTGKLLVGFPLTDPYDAWLGDWEFFGNIFDKGNSGALAVTVTITGLAGNWDAVDPADRPRVIGTLNGDIVGGFDAVYCDKLDDQIIAE